MRPRLDRKTLLVDLLLDSDDAVCIAHDVVHGRDVSTIDIDQANGFGNRYGTLAFAQAAPLWQDFLANGPR